MKIDPFFQLHALLDHNEEVEHDGSDWGVPPETQAVRDARIRRDAIEDCAQIVLREARRLRDEGDEYDSYIAEKLLVLAEAILK